MTKSANNKKPGLLRSIVIVLLITMTVSFVLDTLLTILENVLRVSLYETFPYTRLAVFVLTVIAYRSYLRKNGVIEKSRNKLVRLAKTTGLVVLFMLIAVGILGHIKGGVGQNVYQSNVEAMAYLDKNRELYEDCKNSVVAGLSIVTPVTTEYYQKANSSEEIDKMYQTGLAFMEIVKEQCEQPIEEYEVALEAFKDTQDTINNANVSLLAKMTGFEHATTPPERKHYFNKRLPGHDGFVFDENDVRTYFEDNL